MSPDSVSLPVRDSIKKEWRSEPSAIDQKKSSALFHFKTELKPKSIFFIISLHSIALYYFLTFPYLQHKFLIFWTFVTLHCGGLGVTAGVHRLWSHQSYKAKLPLRILLATLYYSAGQNSIYNWVRDHRVHHKYTDTEADPHDTNRGFWFSHVGWLMMKKTAEVYQKGREIDMSDIVSDPVVQFFDDHSTLLRLILVIVIPVGIPVYFFDQSLKWSIVSQVFMRYPCILNITWSVNSFAHMFGYHSYDRSIRPAENIWVGWAAGGEGWHNYHHVFPWDYQAAELKSQFFNVTALWIDLFVKIGWAYDLKTASKEQIKRIVKRRGDGTHAIFNTQVHVQESSP